MPPIFHLATRIRVSVSQAESCQRCILGPVLRQEQARLLFHKLSRHPAVQALDPPLLRNLECRDPCNALARLLNTSRVNNVPICVNYTMRDSVQYHPLCHLQVPPQHPNQLPHCIRRHRAGYLQACIQDLKARYNIVRT